MKKVMGILLFGLAIPAFSAPPVPVDPESGKYLGNTGSRYDPDSIYNPYGRYGSRYSPDSVNNNPYGIYGSPYSPKSPNNPYAPSAPVIIDPNGECWLDC